MRHACGVVDGLIVSKSVVIPQAELMWKFSRSSGPGGQSVNTTDSKAQLVFDVVNSRGLSEYLRARALIRLESKLVDGCVVISASEQRSQLQNRRAAEQRLVEVLQEATAPPPRARRPTRPTKASAERRIKEKKGRGRTKALRGSTNKDVE
ncbi:MAG: alternative ribosome rescue aminoacyl-tRNA hydrolase ArfB [Actinomycetota bacterium]|nr:alternative ribosome rescue aminoacyl-tRNA hydrolase ArfB [Actinomycetota bacterium]